LCFLLQAAFRLSFFDNIIVDLRLKSNVVKLQTEMRTNNRNCEAEMHYTLPIFALSNLLIKKLTYAKIQNLSVDTVYLCRQNRESSRVQ